MKKFLRYVIEGTPHEDAVIGFKHHMHVFVHNGGPRTKKQAAEHIQHWQSQRPEIKHWRVVKETLLTEVVTL